MRREDFEHVIAAAANGTESARWLADLAATVMTSLSEKRAVFHTEADFQHAFAWELQLHLPEAQLRLERPLSAQTNERLDILAQTEDLTVAVELKYPCSALETVCRRSRAAANVRELWETPRPSRRLAADTQFRFHEGQVLAEQLDWSGTATWWRKEGLPAAVDLTGSYPARWRPYSTVNGTGRGEFRWTAAFVSTTR